MLYEVITVPIILGRSFAVLRNLVGQNLVPMIRIFHPDGTVLRSAHPEEIGTVITSYSIHYTKLYDSAEETAHTVSSLLEKRGLLKRNPPAQPRFFVTDVSERFERVGGGFLGLPLGRVTQIDLDGYSFS